MIPALPGVVTAVRAESKPPDFAQSTLLSCLLTILSKAAILPLFVA
jgi:hypothetical protein